jgi:hypothetical protein
MSDFEAILETGGAAAVEFAAAAIAEHGGKTGQCANCREPLLGPYCAVCGQPRDIHRRSFGGLLKDFVQDVASFDSRILRTARALLFKPGELARAYHEGRTQPFVPAVRLYLFVSLMFFLLLSMTGIALIQFEMQSNPLAVQIDAKGHPYVAADGERQALPQRYADGNLHYNFNTRISFFSRLGSIRPHIPADARQRMLDKLHDRTQRAAERGRWITQGINSGLGKLMADPASLNGPITSWVPRVLFLLLPLFALLLAAFYWRQRGTFLFVDHLVFSLSFHSFVFALLMGAALVAQVLPSIAVDWVVVAVVPVYLLLAMRRMYRQSWIWTGVKFTALSTIYTLFFLLPAFGMIISLAVFGVEGPHLG